MVELRAYDPGDKYTGVAYFRQPDGPNDPLSRDPVVHATGWACYDARVADPDDALDELGRHLVASGGIPVLYVVWERFRLYPDMAEEQSNSEFRTSQSIGAMRWMIRNVNNNVRVARGQAPVTSFVYGAEAKRPAREILRSKGIRSTAKRLKRGPGEHAVDAELHGWHAILDGIPNEGGTILT